MLFIDDAGDLELVPSGETAISFFSSGEEGEEKWFLIRARSRHPYSSSRLVRGSNMSPDSPVRKLLAISLPIKKRHMQAVFLNDVDRFVETLSRESVVSHFKKKQGRQCHVKEQCHHQRI